MAQDWWERDGSCRLLHDINPARTQFITDRCAIFHKTVLDVGCGGGILTEALAKLGAHVTGIDAADAVIACAKAHAAEQGGQFPYLALRF